MGTMNFDAVEAGLFCSFCRADKIFDKLFYGFYAQSQCACVGVV